MASGMYRMHQATTDLSLEMLKAISWAGTLPFRLLYKKLRRTHPTLTETKLRNRIQYYKKKDMLGGSAKAGYQLKEKGVQALETLEISLLQQTAKWDGNWRIIAFDIPEEKREARDALRRLIRQLGCRQLQRSLWVHPLPCLEQFRAIQKAYGVNEHIVLMETKWLNNHQKLFREFRKTYPNL